jgi:hypothetical protein
MVKAYKRSAAGMETELVTDIRSPSACLVYTILGSTSLALLLTRIENHETYDNTSGQRGTTFPLWLAMGPNTRRPQGP